MVKATRSDTVPPGIAVFNSHAERYDAWFGSQRGRALFNSEVHCFRRLAEGLPRPWLEIGVGTGRFAEALAIDAGVDPAMATLRYASGRRVRVASALGQTLPFPDARFGGVFVIVTVCFAQDPLELLEEARRVVTRAGGVVLGIVPAPSPWGRFYAAEGGSGHLFYSRARFLSLPQLQRLAHAAGLRFERSVSTLFQPPAARRLRMEDPKPGARKGAGFVSILYRPANDRQERRRAGRT